MNFNKISIESRLIVSFLIIILALIAISISTIIQMKKTTMITREIYNHPYTVSNAARDIEINIISMHRSMKDVVLAENNQELQKAISIVNGYEQIVLKTFDLVFERYLGSRSDIEDVYKTFLDWQIIRNEVISLVKNDQHKSAVVITKGRGLEHIELIFTKISGLVEFADYKVTSYQNDAFEKQQKVTRDFIIFVGAMLILSVLIAFTIIRSITIPVSSTIKRIKEISRDHFEVEINLSGSSQMELLSQSVDQLNVIAEHLNMEIQERKVIQIELERYRTSLEKLVEKRTHDLHEAQELLSRSIDDASIGVVFVNPGGKFEKSNRKFCEIIGYTEEELQKLTFQDITFPEDYTIGADIVKKLVEGKVENAEISKRYIRKDGKIIYARVFTVLIRDENNNPVHFFSQILDITEHKTVELELANYRENLEELVKERTAELEEKNKDLEHYNKLFIGREFRIKELKEKVKELEKQE
ncbi:PAS domain S-box protein [Candidatus Cloacimonadota bacterium]